MARGKTTRGGEAAEELHYISLPDSSVATLLERKRREKTSAEERLAQLQRQVGNVTESIAKLEVVVGILDLRMTVIKLRGSGEGRGAREHATGTSTDAALDGKSDKA